MARKRKGVDLSKKVGKTFLTDILREVYLTIEESNFLYSRVKEEAVQALLDGKPINLFNLVIVEPLIKPERIIKNAFGEEDITVPERIVLKARITPSLQEKWKEINN